MPPRKLSLALDFHERRAIHIFRAFRIFKAQGVASRPSEPKRRCNNETSTRHSKERGKACILRTRHGSNSQPERGSLMTIINERIQNICFVCCFQEKVD